MDDVETLLKDFDEKGKTMIIGYLSKSTGSVYEDICIEPSDDFIYKKLKNLILDYQTYLKNAFADL